MLTFITGNKSKIKEVQSVFGDTFVAHDIDLPEIQSIEYGDVIRKQYPVALAQGCSEFCI